MKNTKIMRYLFLLLIFGLLSQVYTFAGEVSNFEILGFDNSMTYVSFAEYGVDSKSQSYASIFLVNINNNNFAPNGIFKQRYQEPSSLADSGKPALYDQILKASSVLKQYNINPLNRGRLIYILLDGEDNNNYLDFVDYKSNTQFNVALNARINGVGSSASGAFSINLNIKNMNTGSRVSRVVGSPNYYRQGVVQYKIRSIYTTLDNKSLVFVVEKYSFDNFEDPNINYMIETIKWQ